MWRSKRNVSGAGASGAGGVKSAASSGRSRRISSTDDDVVCKYQAEGRLRKLFRKIGSSIESLIDATPLGVPTPCEPWSPLTDKKKALLSNPISVLKVVTEIMSEYSPSKFIKLLGAAVGGATAQWLHSSALMLMGLREGLANAVLGENNSIISDPPVIVESEDVTVPGEGAGGAFVDLRTDNSTQKDGPEARGMSKGLSSFLTNRVIPFLDSLTLRAHGIVVTSDDCSVECSLTSLIDEHEYRICSPSSVPESISSDKDDFEDCPSVVTEIAISDELDDDEATDLNDALNNSNQDLAAGYRDDEEYVITNVSEIVDDEDFIDVCAELPS